MKIKFLIILLFSFLSKSFAQDLIFTSEYKFVGYFDNEPAFILYHDNDERINSSGLYTIGIEEGCYGFKLIKEVDNNLKDVVFVNNELLIIGTGNSIRNYTLTGFIDNNKVFTLSEGFGQNFVFLEEDNSLIVFINKGDDRFVTYQIDPSKSLDNIQKLPIKGYRGYTVDNCLYFSYFHENYEYSPFPDDIFKVKIGDWNNPELVFTSHEYDNWFLYPNKHLIVSDVNIKELKREENKKVEIIYDVKTDRYDTVSNIIVNQASGPAYLKYNNKYYGYFTTDDNKWRIKTIGLKILPEAPQTFPFDDYHVLEREVLYNLPLEEKTFDGTFITSELLRFADEQELNKLTKEQLRILRNVIYAQQGYVFESRDLIDFFNRFEWYRKIVNTNESNEEVFILKEDRERAEYILEVEKKK